MFIGYARVSTEDQHTENQSDQLSKAGCERVYTETASGGRWDRPQLQACLEQLRKDDVLVVWKVDRLGRSLGDLLRILEKIDAAGATFKSLTEPQLDTTGPCGKLMFQMIGAFAEFERSMIRERTKLGLARARANGKKGGGPHALSPAREARVIKQVLSGELTMQQAAEEEGVDRTTIWRICRRAELASK